MRKRAIALSGGGPAVGIEIGALQAFEERGMRFEVFSCACVGSWVGCLYNSLPARAHKAQRVKDFFFDQIFVPDDIYASFPINYKVFRVDPANHVNEWLRKVLDPATYQHLVLPERLWAHGLQWLREPPRSPGAWAQRLTEGVALNPWMRLAAELQWKVGHSGVSGLVNSTGFVHQHIDMARLARSPTTVYLNAYNLSQNRHEVFVNHKHPRLGRICADALMAGSSVLHYTATRTIEGSTDQYCEGAVVHTVNLDHLLTEHPDLDEIWVVKIADRRQVTPPANLLDSALLGVMLPFDTISDNDVRLFAQQVAAHNRTHGTRVRLIDIPMAYERVNYHWSHANLAEGIQVGYEGTMAELARQRPGGAAA